MGYPLSFAALSSSPKGAPLDYAGNFIATVEAVPLGKVDCRAAARRKGKFPLSHPQKLKIQLKNAPDGSKNNLDVLY